MTLQEKLIDAVKTGKKIMRKDFYIYETIPMVADAIEFILEDAHINKENKEKIYENLLNLAESISEEMSNIEVDRAIKTRIYKHILNLNIGLNKPDAEWLADNITSAELYRRKRSDIFNISHGRHFYDPNSDATKDFIDSEPALMKFKEIFEGKEQIKIEIYDKEFEKDIIHLDEILKERRINYLKVNYLKNGKHIGN